MWPYIITWYRISFCCCRNRVYIITRIFIVFFSVHRRFPSLGRYRKMFCTFSKPQQQFPRLFTSHLFRKCYSPLNIMFRKCYSLLNIIQLNLLCAENRPRQRPGKYSTKNLKLNSKQIL